MQFKLWLEKTKYEDTFTHEDVLYDLKKLRYILKDRKVYEQKLSKLLWLLKDNPPTKEDLKRANKTKDYLNIPIFVATTDDGKLVPIDGYHRLIKAHELNIKSLPAKKVTKKDLEKCKIH